MELPDFHHPEYKQKIYEEWCHFQREETVDASIIRSAILASWKRCRSLRVDPFHPMQKECESAEFKKIEEANAEFIESSRTIMNNIFSVITQSRSTMVLANAEGVVLRVLASSDSVSRQSPTRPGSIAREAYSGTAGIATCLEEQKAIEVFAAEHYCVFNQDWVCSAAPIFDRKKRIVGVLSITSHCDSFHPHTSGMIRTAVNAISEQLHLRELLGEQKALLEVLDEGVLFLDKENQVCAINKKAMTMLHLKDKPIGKVIYDILSFADTIQSRLGQRTTIDDEETQVQLQNSVQSCPCVLSAAPNQVTKGLVLTLRETTRMREFATRITGAKAMYTFEDIIGTSARIQNVVQQARKVACSELTVLIQGESGTGKELFAQAVHNGSQRAQRPFIVVNCGALPRELVQSELFGYTEGAFTGASKQGKPGKFELADGGSIFLDEIGEMPLDAQVSLLRLLQDGELTRVGGKRTRHVDVRVIAATNRNLQMAVQQHFFRSDLYYRLNVVPLEVPSLRERKEDVAVLIAYFIQKLSKSMGKAATDFTPEALAALQAYAWPGNVRELENAMERLIHMAAGVHIPLEELPEHIRVLPVTVEPVPCASSSIEESLQQHEEKAVLQALQQHQGNVKATAQALGISRSTLYYKMNRLGLGPERFRGPGAQQAMPDVVQHKLADLTSQQVEVLFRLLEQQS